MYKINYKKFTYLYYKFFEYDNKIRWKIISNKRKKFYICLYKRYRKKIYKFIKNWENKDYFFCYECFEFKKKSDFMRTKSTCDKCIKKLSTDDKKLTLDKKFENLYKKYL